jgi:hypothetical protein
MRAILAFAIAATFVLILRNISMSANAGQNVAKSAAAIVTTLNAADMPQYVD